MKIRSATVHEAQVLSQLAVEAKAAWGYPRTQLRAWQNALTVTRNSITRFPTFVADVRGENAGFYQLATSPSCWEFEHFWVRPRFMRQGIGRAMLFHAAALAKDAGLTELVIDSDPNAEAFYAACGAQRVGVIPAPTEGNPSRVRPQLRLVVTQAGSRKHPRPARGRE